MTDVSLRMRGSTLAVIAVCSTLCACSAGDDAPASPLALYKGEANQDNALLMGTLSLEGRCLYVTPEAAQATGVHALILLPATAASWDDTTGELVVGGERARPGDRVGFGGGFAGSLDWADWQAPPDSSCDTSQAFAAGDSMYTGAEIP